MSNDYDGIALRSVNYGEGNKLLDIFTKEKGKLTVIARGAREIKKTKGNITELFSRMNYNLFKGKEFYYLNQSSVIESYSGIREDIDKISFASYIAEMTNSSLEIEEENEKLYLLLDKTFKMFSEGLIDYKKLLFAYQIKMISLIGYKPLLKPVRENISPPLYFSYDTGEILSKREIGSGVFNIEVGYDLILIMNKILYSRLEDLDNIEINKLQYIKLENILYNYIAFHLEKTNYKSLKMLKSLNLL